MRRTLATLALAVVGLVGCTAGQPRHRSLIPAEVPEGTVFAPLETVADFTVAPSLRIVRDPENPGGGVAAVKLLIISKATEVRRNVHAAVWLPEGVTRYTPVSLIGTNTESELWKVDLSPSQPKMGVLTNFNFQDFAQRDQVIAAFSGPTLVKVLWEGGVRYFQFRGDLWTVEVDEGPARHS